MSDIIKNNNNNFSDIISIIENSKQRAMKAVNAELINMYWEVGKYLSSIVKDSSLAIKSLTRLQLILRKIILQSRDLTVVGFTE